MALPPHLIARIDRTNAALEVAMAQPAPAAGTLRVCRATEDEWSAFADTDGQFVRPNLLERFADIGEIHIIEFAITPHEKAAVNSQGPRRCPDLSYGPRRSTPGTVLPPGVPIADDFRTVKIEIGVSQLWGMAHGHLDHKAISIWAVMPGVEYVLCVNFDPDFAKAEFKMYDVRATPLAQLAPRPIAAPRTVVQCDSHRILGIPSGMALPKFFPKRLSADLYAPLRWAMK